MGNTVPTLTLVAGGGTAQADTSQGLETRVEGAKFTPINLSRYFNASSADFGAHEQAKVIGGESARDGLVRLPAGRQTFRGIPFVLGPEGVREKSWVLIGNRATSAANQHLEITLHQKAGYLCFAWFCDWDTINIKQAVVQAFQNVGQRLAEVILVYDDGTEHVVPVRRRFQVSSPTFPWGQLCFAAQPHRQNLPLHLTNPLDNAQDWGWLQTGLTYDATYFFPILWLWALPNPKPEQAVRTLRIKAKADDSLALCGLTLLHGRGNPLRYGRLQLYRFDLPEPTTDEGRWRVDVDLGVVARTYLRFNEGDPDSWLPRRVRSSPAREKPIPAARYLYAEVTASPEAALILRDSKTGQQYPFDLSRMATGRPAESGLQGARIQVLEQEKVWLHGQVVDSATDRPTPVRLAFRSKEGHYLPPYGHRADVNHGWFQDYGADLKLASGSFAYVDGTFQVELPVGEVEVEISKGFEYEPVRQKLQVESSQRELRLEISRHTDLRFQGWVTADTHVHFLSPSTAILEGQAEGLNLINLLAAQWGEMFSNVGDLPHGPLTSADGQTVVWPGTENRQHILGHLNLLGGRGEPVYPMSAGGTWESYLGDPLWSSLGEWADACRKRGGVVVAAHFPNPYAELAADIVLGKIDAIETGFFSADHPYLMEWYRYLNCGYRLPVVGGTDKMGAYMAVGTLRTYAHLAGEEFSFASWAQAVRKGNTFTTSGPLLTLQIDGHVPGAEITLGSGGGTLAVSAAARSAVPVQRLEIVLNGRVVASREERAGARELSLQENVRVPGPGWLAARCASASSGAHTSPVYLLVPGQELFCATTAAYFLTMIEGAETWVDQLATRPNPERLAGALQVFQDARAHLQRRLHEHGVQY